MVHVEYRELALHEIDTIAPLWRKLNAHHARHSPDFSEVFRGIDFESRIRRLRRHRKLLRVIVADVPGGGPVGYAIGSITDTYDTQRGELDSMYVEEEWRGQGIGRELTSSILNWLDGSGITNIIIAVAAGNEEAIEFYGRLGFAPRAITLRRKPSPQE
ncbi:MAG: GNAT family N-acetyltransferase [Alkalispirochaeta sp.]